MVFGNRVFHLVVLFSFLVADSHAAPVIKSSPQILSAKLDRDGPSNWDWQHHRRLLSPLIDSGDLGHPLPSSSPTPLPTSSYEKTRGNFDKTRDSLKVPAHAPKKANLSHPLTTPSPTPLSSNFGDKCRSAFDKSRDSLKLPIQQPKKADPGYFESYSAITPPLNNNKTRNGLEKTRDSLKVPTHQPKKSDPSLQKSDSHLLPSYSTTPLSTTSDKARSSFDKTRDKPLATPKTEPAISRVFNSDLFHFLHQYERLAHHQLKSEEIRMRSQGPVPGRRGKQYEKVDVIQKIATSEEEEEEGNVQKIERKEKAEPGEEMITLEEIVEVDDNEELIDELVESSEEERGNKTKSADEDKTVSTEDNYIALLILSFFSLLILSFYALACAEIFCKSCRYRPRDDFFVPQMNCAHSYYTTPKPATPPPPYHLFAPPPYFDIVSEIQRVPCACPPGTPCPPYSREWTPRGDRNTPSIIHQDRPFLVDQTRQAFDPAPYLDMLDAADKNAPIKSDGSNKESLEKRETEFEIKPVAQMFVKPVSNSGENVVHKIPTEPILCPCSQGSGETSVQSSPSDHLVRQSISFIDYSCDSFESSGRQSSSCPSAFKIPFDRHLDGQSLFDKSVECSRHPPDQSHSHCSSVDRVNETEKTALFGFMEDNRQFRNNLKARIRNSVSFSSSQNNCTDQLDKQYKQLNKHSGSDTGLIDKAADYSMARMPLKHNSCFTIGALHQSIPELIKFSEDKVRKFTGHVQPIQSNVKVPATDQINNCLEENKEQIPSSHNGHTFQLSNCVPGHAQHIQRTDNEPTAGQMKEFDENILKTSDIRLTNPSLNKDNKTDRTFKKDNASFKSGEPILRNDDKALNNDDLALENKDSAFKNTMNRNDLPFKKNGLAFNNGDLGVNNTTDLVRGNTCDRASGTSSTTWQADGTAENLKTKIFFLDYWDDEDNVEIT